ncbi:MAG: hypothetical protein ACLGIR_09120 [Actinomycetes bacterium]
MRTRSPRPVLLALAGVLALGATACDQVQEGVDTARDIASDTRAEVDERAQQVRFCVTVLDILADVNAQDVEAAAASMDELVATAPAEVADAARTVRAGVEAARGGDESALGTQEFRDAAAELTTYARDTCDPTS